MKTKSFLIIVLACALTTTSLAFSFEQKNPFATYNRRIVQLREDIVEYEIKTGKRKAEKKTSGLSTKVKGKKKGKGSKKEKLVLESKIKDLAKKMKKRESCVDEHMDEANKELEKQIQKKETLERQIEEAEDKGGREGTIKMKKKLIETAEKNIIKMEAYLAQLKEWDDSLPEEEIEEDDKKK